MQKTLNLLKNTKFLSRNSFTTYKLLKYFSRNVGYVSTHEWISYTEDSNIVEIGVSDFAQNELGDLVHAELIAVEEEVKKGDSIATLESVKGVSDVYSPVEGIVVEVNEPLGEDPVDINEKADDTWIIKVEIKKNKEEQLDGLMNKGAYEEYIKKC